MLLTNSETDVASGAEKRRDIVAVRSHHEGAKSEHFLSVTKLLLQSVRPIESQLTESDLLILRVIYAPAHAARLSWQKFRDSGTPIEAMDTHSYELLPPLTQRLIDLAVVDSCLDKLKGHQRFTWTNNQIKLRKLADCLVQFKERGIEALVLNGSALALSTALMRGAKPLGPQWVMVRSADYARSLDLVRQLQVSVRVCRHLPGDLHNLVWQQAELRSLNGQNFLVMNPPDLLICHLLSKKLTEPEQAVWFVDAVRLLTLCNTSEHIDIFTRHLSESSLALPVLKAWSFIKSVCRLIDLDPSSFLLADTLDSMRVSMKEVSIRCVGKLRGLV